MMNKVSLTLSAVLCCWSLFAVCQVAQPEQVLQPKSMETSPVAPLPESHSTVAQAASKVPATETDAQQLSGDSELLQPGDVLYLNFPGEAEFNKDFTIDAQGNIDLPELGPFRVSGERLSVAANKLRQLLSVMFKNIERLQVELRQRNLLIQVMGYIKSPGQVSIAATGNVQTAIQQAGGLLPGAQLDKMQIQRSDGERVSFNYKDYLDSGDPASLPQLQSMDTVFVPASPLTGNVQIEFDAATLAASGDAAEDTAAFRIFGEVQSPGRFALKPGLTLIDALMRAGGVTRYAAVEQIKIISDGEPRNFNLKRYLESGDSKLMPALSAGATIFVPIQQDEIKTGNTVVYVMGEVFKPGAFESGKEASLLDILANAGGPTRFAESRQIRILRANGTVLPFDLQGYTEGKGGAQLPKVVPGDAIFVPEKTDVNEASWLKVPTSRSIRIMGQVNNPGRFEWNDEMNLLDLLSHAQGPTSRADIANIRILSAEKSGAKPTVFNLERFVKYGGDLSQIPQLSAGYTVVVPELPQDPSDNKAQWVRQSKENSIYIMGAVGSPGRYTFNTELAFLDILTAANGPTADADLHNVKVVRRNLPHAASADFNLALYLQTGDETILPQVQPGDTIFVPSKNANWLDKPQHDVVKVIGAVNKPGRYSFNESMTLLDLIAEAGGSTNSAYLERIIILNSRQQRKAVSFDMLAYLKAPQDSELPVIRPGDTLFIPDKADGEWVQFMNSVTDIFKVVSTLAILGGL
jgi:protein involved in polysaccharide export with SLBB domain